jgi:hypothetical protein
VTYLDSREDLKIHRRKVWNKPGSGNAPRGKRKWLVVAIIALVVLTRLVHSLMQN